MKPRIDLRAPANMTATQSLIIALRLGMFDIGDVTLAREWLWRMRVNCDLLPADLERVILYARQFIEQGRHD